MKKKIIKERDVLNELALSLCNYDQKHADSEAYLDLKTIGHSKIFLTEWLPSKDLWPMDGLLQK
jgi:hypothetical protein